MLSRIGHNLREAIHKFSGKICAGLYRPEKRFIEEMIFGIQASGTVVLSEIGRSLQEQITTKKTVDRLSRNLGNKVLEKAIVRSILREGAPSIREDTLLIVDTSDIIKKHAKKMEHLSEVRDGSEKTIGNGYSTIQIVGAECGESEIVPLYHSLYSSHAEGHDSENRELLRAIWLTFVHCGKRGIFTFDRGGDRWNLYKFLFKWGSRFIIRQRGDRHILFRGQKMATREIANRVPMLYADYVVKEERGQGKKFRIQYGFVPVRLSERPNTQLWLMVIKGFGQEPMMLLTNIPLRKKRTLLSWMMEAYITRWRIEETIRFMKQSYQEENIRVLTYRRLKNMAAMLLAVIYFAARYLGTASKLKVLTLSVLKEARRLFGVPDFRYYAMADGIRKLLSRGHKGPLYPRGGHLLNDLQLTLPLNTS